MVSLSVTQLNESPCMPHACIWDGVVVTVFPPMGYVRIAEVESAISSLKCLQYHNGDLNSFHWF